MGHWSAPPAIVCGRRRIYSESPIVHHQHAVPLKVKLDVQITSGRLTAIQAMVRLLAVWDHASPPAATLFSTARSLRLLSTPTGAARSGVEVRDLRGEGFVGEASGGGKAAG